MRLFYIGFVIEISHCFMVVFRNGLNILYLYKFTQCRNAKTCATHALTAVKSAAKCSTQIEAFLGCDIFVQRHLCSV